MMAEVYTAPLQPPSCPPPLYTAMLILYSSTSLTLHKMALMANQHNSPFIYCHVDFILIYFTNPPQDGVYGKSPTAVDTEQFRKLQESERHWYVYIYVHARLWFKI